MAIRTSGALPLTEIAAEFGGSAPYSLSQYYRGGARVPSGPAQNANISTSGAISLSMFYGAASAFGLVKTITGNVNNFNLRNEAVAAGWNGSLPLVATITINPGVYVSGASIGAIAFDTGTAAYPAGSSLTIVNNGFIVGMGGSGGDPGFYNFLTSQTVAGTPGSAGSLALRVNLPTRITNNGTIGGGGGGGGAGQTRYYTSSGKFVWTYSVNGGSGGGGRSGAVSSAGANPGTASGPGAGGAGVVDGGVRGGAGGAGGQWGAAGAAGGGGSGGNALNGPYAAGGAGAAISGNGNITWVATGTRLGAIS